MKELTKLIRDRRLELKITQEDLAHKLGWERSQFVSNIERGKADWPKDALPKLGKVLKLSQQKIWEKFEMDSQMEFEGLFQ